MPDRGHRDDACLFSDIEWAQIVRVLGLPRREAQVVRGLLCGWSDQEMADYLSTSCHTVGTYLRRIRARLQVHSKPDILLEAFRAWRAVGGPPPPERSRKRLNE